MLTFCVVTLAITVIILIYAADQYLKNIRGIRRELADGKTLRDLDEMVRDTRDELMVNFDEVSAGLDKKIIRLENLKRDAQQTIARLEALLDNERLKILEERGILFAIEAGDKSGGKTDRNKRIADLLKSGASVEEVARITEASVREVELVRLLIRRATEAEGA